MNSHLTYFFILACSLAGPLLLSFDKKVAFYKKWRYVFPALFFPAVIYIVWDMYFTALGVWSFNEKYITGIKIHNLPVEEVLFFFVVPYCCIFIYACTRAYFPRLQNKKWADRILWSLAGLLLLTGMIFYDRYYTSWTFIATAVFISIIYLFRHYCKGFDAVSFLTAFLVVLIPFLLVNGLLTALPAVLYNNAENLGIRIYSIPLEDIFYGMLLLLMNIVLYEKFINRDPV